MTVTLANPGDAHRFEPGDMITFKAGPPPWWKRLWRWVRRGFRKAPPPPVMTVTAIDHENGVVTVGSPRWDA